MMTTSRTLRSKDGTTIGFRSVGEGPSVIVIPGALSEAEDYAAFAEALAEGFSVHTIERRGRGLSGPQGDRYDIERECEDVAAVRVETDARLLVGHSYGGLIALEAARNNPAVAKLAVYEPGVSVDGAISMSWVPRYRRLLAEGRPLDAFVEFCIATGPAVAQRTPRWLMKVMLLVAMERARRRRVYRLLATNLQEHLQVARLDNSYPSYREVAAPTLLMAGGRSGLAWVDPAIGRLSTVLPTLDSRRLPGLDHFGPDRTGPREVAAAVRRFFTAPG